MTGDPLNTPRDRDLLQGPAPGARGRVLLENGPTGATSWGGGPPFRGSREVRTAYDGRDGECREEDAQDHGMVDEQCRRDDGHHAAQDVCRVAGPPDADEQVKVGNSRRPRHALRHDARGREQTGPFWLSGQPGTACRGQATLIAANAAAAVPNHTQNGPGGTSTKRTTSVTPQASAARTINHRRTARTPRIRCSDSRRLLRDARGKRDGLGPAGRASAGKCAALWSGLRVWDERAGAPCQPLRHLYQSPPLRRWPEGRG